MAVVDNGCGFLSSLSRHPRLVASNDAAAVRLALEPRVTCNPDLEIRPEETANQGVGLTVVRWIVAEGRGVMQIASGDAVLELAGVRVNVGHIIHELRGGAGPGGARFG